MLKHLFAALALLAIAPNASAQADLGGLKMFSAIDLVSDFGIQNPPADSGRLRVRSFEIAAFAPVDPTFDAMLALAGHDEEGKTEIELHEAYISSSKVIPRTRFKVGRFFLGVGRLNQFHVHDWPFTHAPKSHTTFFSEEGVADTGIEFGHLLATETPIDIVVGVTNGWHYGHTTTGGRRPKTATHYLHPTLFLDMGDSSGWLLGASYLGRTDDDSVQTRLSGFDVTYKKRNGKTISRLFQTENYHRVQTSSTTALNEDVGGYLYGEMAVGEEGWATGLRLDWFSNLSLTDGAGETRRNFDYGAAPTVTYRTSEFSFLRASYFCGVETKAGDENRIEQRIDLQLVALIGTHPSHDF